MGGMFIQSGSLSGEVSSKGTLKANVVSQAVLKATIVSNGTLNATVKANGTLTGTVRPQGALHGIIHMPRNGKSAYEIAVDNGFIGTEVEWLESLKGGGKAAKIGEVTLLGSAWVGADRLYHQIVDIEGVTENSQVDLTPNVQQLAIFYEKDLSFVTENEGGVLTVYAIGQKPTNDYTIQVTITEVSV